MSLFSSRSVRCFNTPPRRTALRLRLERLEDRSTPSAGAFDPTFGSGGIVTTAVGSGSSHATGALLQSNGDIIAYGQTGAGLGLALARYSPSGKLDTTFGKNGIVSNTMSKVTQAALEPDGKIVIVGRTLLVRYDSDGSLDKTFGSSGMVTVPANFYTYSLLIQPTSGDIVVGGDFSNSYSALLRYTSNGTLDSTFGSGGKVVAPSSNGIIITSLALENGDIVAGGITTTGATGALARYTLSGSLDMTFGSSGIEVTQAVHSLLVQANGQIVAVGDAAGVGNNVSVWELARYNINGNLDSSFGNGGIVTSNISGSDLTNGSALQSNGQIVVTGWSIANDVFELGVYNSNGSPDTSFGSGGFVTTSWFAFPTAQGGGVVVQPDGKLVVAASAQVGGNFDLRLARFGPSAPQIGSFAASPNPVTAGSAVNLTVSNITLADPNSTITQVAFYVQSNGTNTLLGYGTQTGAGAWTFSFTVNLTPGNYTLIAQAQDSDGVFSDPLAITLLVL